MDAREEVRKIIALALLNGNGHRTTGTTNATDAILSALAAAGLEVVRTEFVNDMREMVTNGDWCEELWCVSRNTYEAAYNSDLVRLHVDAASSEGAREG